MNNSIKLDKEEHKRGNGSLGYLNPEYSRQACADGKSSFRSNKRISQIMQGTTFKVDNSEEKATKRD